MFLQGNLISFTRGTISRIIFNVECAAFIKKMSKLLYITQDWNGHWRKKKKTTLGSSFPHARILLQVWCLDNIC